MIIYTSGTTGAAQGRGHAPPQHDVPAEAGEVKFDFFEEDEQLCFLPLCHVLERLVSV
jgi:long-chain acyl-CoA synthetase